MSSKKKKLSAVIAVACIIVLLLGIIAAAFFWKEKDPEHNHGTTEPTQGMTEPSGDATEPTGTEPTTGSEPTGPDGTEPSDPTDPVGPTDPTESSPTTPTELPHKHDYQVREIVEPTCMENGYTVYACACGDSYTSDAVTATGHRYQWKVTKEPTCTGKGTMTYTCQCGDSYQRDIAATGHQYTHQVVEPTYDAKGYTLHVCAKCGNSYKDNYTDKLERPVEQGHKHDFKVDRVIEPTCNRYGCTLYKCSCGQSYVVDFVDVLGHDFKGDVIAPTKETPGYTHYVCSRCGENYNDDFVCQVGVSANPADNLPYAKGAVPMKAGSHAELLEGFDWSTYLGPVDIEAGTSWDGSPIVYTYSNGTTGTVRILGAYYQSSPGVVVQVDNSANQDMGGLPRIDGISYCEKCGRPVGDGTNGTCLSWMTNGEHTCPNCGEAVHDRDCHTCPEN